MGVCSSNSGKTTASNSPKSNSNEIVLKGEICSS